MLIKCLAQASTPAEVRFLIYFQWAAAILIALIFLMMKSTPYAPSILRINAQLKRSVRYACYLLMNFPPQKVQLKIFAPAGVNDLKHVVNQNLSICKSQRGFGQPVLNTGNRYFLNTPKPCSIISRQKVN
eukprot:TRINITY_DN28391_c0_g1_i1.p2 TRINITY_DN28391_c0_g1~~TRINITY_DN28391_c0_g1_i1.p2  ORF type:complete len:130 (-),score=5.91 TRINITY_DN28391_c0_g1_i1:89-478(-)